VSFEDIINSDLAT